MTTAPTPSELLALRAGATQQIRLREKFGPEGLDLKLDPQIVIRLLDRIETLENKLELDPSNGQDGISLRDQAIWDQGEQISQLRAELEARKPLPGIKET